MESDKLGQYFAACIQDAPGKELRRQAMYDRYKDWCKENGYYAESIKVFRPEVEKRYKCEKKRPDDDKRVNATPMVLNVEFVPEENPEPEFVPE